MLSVAQHGGQCFKVERCDAQVGIDCSNALQCSAKTGEGVPAIIKSRLEPTASQLPFMGWASVRFSCEASSTAYQHRQSPMSRRA